MFEILGHLPYKKFYMYSLEQNLFFFQNVPNDNWRVSRINEKYDVIDTYPNLIGVPKQATDEFIRQVASFRSRGRLPVRCLQLLFLIFISKLHEIVNPFFWEKYEKYFIILGPVVQSVVSLTSLLRVISLTVLANSIYNILIFFAEKM